jgi:Domain of unknown function (DUF4424)
MLALLVIAQPVPANDTLATLGAGGLIPLKSQQISILREDLEISVEQITVKYQFHNYETKPIDAVVAFPLPLLEGGTVEHVPMKLPAKGDNFVDFKVFAAGRQTWPQAEVRAVREGKEITAQVKAAGLPVSVIDENFQAAVKHLEPAKRAELVKAEWLVSDDVGEAAANPDRRYWPYWDTKVTYYWTQHFPASATIEVRHVYRPVVGGSLITLSDPGDERVKPYCGGANAVKRIWDYKLQHPNHKPDEPVFQERQIQYILTTANNWRGPIGEFHLGITTPAADDIVLTCLPGLRKVGPRRYELVRQNFRPAKELELQILQANP